jgi:hypothetical protein
MKSAKRNFVSGSENTYLPFQFNSLNWKVKLHTDKKNLSTFCFVAQYTVQCK